MHVTVSQYETNLWSTQVNNIWQAKPISSRCPVLWQAGFQKSQNLLDCLQSAFSLKIRLVLTSSSTIANHDIYRGFAACVLRFHVGVCLHAFSLTSPPPSFIFLALIPFHLRPKQKTFQTETLAQGVCYVGYCYMYAHELQMNPPSDKKITSKQKLVTINMQISCFMNTNAFFSSTNYIARPKQKICQTETLAQGACYAGYSYMYALQMNPLVTINMQILCFVNTNGFFSSTNYIKNPTHSHDLTFRTFITDYQMNTH